MITKNRLLLVICAPLLTGCQYFGVQTYLIGQWRDFSQEDFEVQIVHNESSGETISISKSHKVVFEKKGHWTNNTFYCASPTSPSDEVEVARELMDESLEVNMEFFDPYQYLKAICTKTQRGYKEPHPYPVTEPGKVVAYPPPKGLIKPGMLQADLDYLPWGPDKTEMINSGSIYCYHSDNPNLPELRVTVINGKVTDVVGGAEDTAGPSYSPPPDTTTTTEDNSNRSWTMWLFDLIFKK